MARGLARETSIQGYDLPARELLNLVAGPGGHALVALDAAGRIVSFSAGAGDLFGCTPEAALGRALAEFATSPGSFEALLHQGDAHASLWMRRRADKVLCDCRIAPIEGHPARWIALFRDLSELHQAQKTIEELRLRNTVRTQQSEKEAEFLRELLRHTIETVQLALAVTDLQSGMIAYVNEGFEQLIGRDRLELIGNTLGVVLGDFPATAGLIEKCIDGIRGSSFGGESSGHREMDFPSGRKDVEIYGRTIAVEGMENQFILLIIEDHTERERLQRKLVQSEKLAAIGQLAAGIAHEIRNPLNTIFNALYDLEEILPNPSAEVREDISISMEEIKRVQGIINNLLDFARDSEGGAEGSSLCEVLRKTVRLVQHDLGNRSIEVKLSLAEVPRVRISENSLKQILINLITNAAQAINRDGTITLTTWQDHRTGSPPTVSLTVADTGCGISARHLANIFNPFFTTKDPGAGTGLGLSVVHSLIRDCGGQIVVESVEGRGTTFTLDLPVAEEE